MVHSYIYGPSETVLHIQEVRTDDSRLSTLIPWGRVPLFTHYQKYKDVTLAATVIYYRQGEGLQTSLACHSNPQAQRRSSVLWFILIYVDHTQFIHAGAIFVLSGFSYKLFGIFNLNQYFTSDSTQISIINDRFSAINKIEDI